MNRGQILSCPHPHVAVLCEPEFGRGSILLDKGLVNNMPALTQIVRSTFYFASFGAVFPTLLVAHMLPGLGPVAASLADGIDAACKAAKPTDDDLERMLVLEQGVEVLAAC